VGTSPRKLGGVCIGLQDATWAVASEPVGPAAARVRSRAAVTAIRDRLRIGASFPRAGYQHPDLGWVLYQESATSPTVVTPPGVDRRRDAGYLSTLSGSVTPQASRSLQLSEMS
jgi:hypothetical protein